MNHFEIEACVIRAKNGNREELLKILEQYKSFIFKNALNYNIKGYDLYDLVQIGYVTLINAVAKYRTGSQTFSTYAYNAIKNSFRNTARQNLKYSGELSLNSPVDRSEGSDTEFIDSLRSMENLEEDVLKGEEVRRLRRAVSRLSSEDLELVIMLYFSGAPLTLYAAKKGLSYPAALQKRDRILKKLGLYLNSGGEKSF